MRQYEKMFELDGIRLNIGKGVLELIVDTAMYLRWAADALKKQ